MDRLVFNAKEIWKAPAKSDFLHNFEGVAGGQGGSRICLVVYNTSLIPATHLRWQTFKGY